MQDLTVTIPADENNLNLGFQTSLENNRENFGKSDPLPRPSAAFVFREAIFHNLDPSDRKS